jgi:hypothetical protein
MEVRSRAAHRVGRSEKLCELQVNNKYHLLAVHQRVRVAEWLVCWASTRVGGVRTHAFRFWKK